MPNIRPYTQQTGASGSIPGRAASPSDFGGDVGESLVRLGQAGIAAVDQMRITDERQAAEARRREADAERLRNKAVQDESLRLGVEIAKGRAQWLQWMADSQQTAPADGAGFTEKFNAEFNTYKEKALQAASFPETRLRYETDLEGVRVSLLDNAIVFEKNARAAAQVNSVRSAFAANENSVRADPPQSEGILAREMEMIDGLSGIPQNKRDELKTERGQAIRAASVEGSLYALINAKYLPGLLEFKNNLETGAWKDKLSPKAYEDALKTTSDAIRTLGGQATQAQIAALQERIRERQVTDNNLSPAEAAVIPDPVERRKAEGLIETSILIGNFSETLRTMPFAEARVYLAGVEAKVREPGGYDNDAREYEAAVAAYNKRVKAFLDDPATFVQTNSPVARQAYTRLTTNPTPEAAQDYASAIVTEQKRMQPDLPPVIMTQAQMGQIKTQLAEIPTTPEGAEQALNLLQSQATLWGSYWPDVSRQLVNEQVLSGPQITAARMVEPSRRSTARLLLEAANVGEKELRKQIDNPQLGTELRAAVNRQLAPLQIAMSYQRRGAKTYSNMADSVELLALKLMTMGENNTSKAVERAANGVIMQDFAFRGSYYVPREEDLKSVETGLKHATSLIPTRSLVPPTSLSGLKPDDIRAGMVDSLKSGGTWVTNDTATGLVLTWPNISRDIVTVNEGGRVRPLEYTWAELKSLAVEAAAASRRAPRFDETQGGAALGGTR